MIMEIKLKIKTCFCFNLLKTKRLMNIMKNNIIHMLKENTILFTLGTKNLKVFITNILSKEKNNFKKFF